MAARRDATSGLLATAFPVGNVCPVQLNARSGLSRRCRPATNPHVVVAPVSGARAWARAARIAAPRCRRRQRARPHGATPSGRWPLSRTNRGWRRSHREVSRTVTTDREGHRQVKSDLAGVVERAERRPRRQLLRQAPGPAGALVPSSSAGSRPPMTRHHHRQPPPGYGASSYAPLGKCLSEQSDQWSLNLDPTALNRLFAVIRGVVDAKASGQRPLIQLRRTRRRR